MLHCLEMVLSISNQWHVECIANEVSWEVNHGKKTSLYCYNNLVIALGTSIPTTILIGINAKM